MEWDETSYTSGVRECKLHGRVNTMRTRGATLLAVLYEFVYWVRGDDSKQNSYYIDHL